MRLACFLFLILFSAIIAGLGTRASISLSRRWGILDVPNPRSSHRRATPRLGGLGILAGFYCGLSAAWLLTPSGSADPWVSAIALAALMMGIVGLWDDLRNTQPKWKFLLQLAAGGVIVSAGMRLEGLSLPYAGTIEFSYLSLPVTLLWLAGFTNVFNFMDGIDGMACGTGIVYASVFAAFAWLLDKPEVVVVAALLGGSCVGFLVFNFPPARTFMGDAGSLFLGMAFSALMVWLGAIAADPAVVTGLILTCSVYLFDGGFTLGRRLVRRENIFRAHRSHLYQRLVQSGLSHGKVTALYFALHLAAGICGVAYWRADETAQSRIVGLTGLLLAGLTVFVLVRERRRTSPDLESK